MGPLFKCAQCGETFRDLDSLSNHMTERHNMNSRLTVFKCFRCAEVFNTAQELTQHMQFDHSCGKPVHCGKCGIQLANQSALAAHMEAQSACSEQLQLGRAGPSMEQCIEPSVKTDNVFICASCGLQCMDAAALQFHEKTHACLEYEARDIAPNLYVKVKRDIGASGNALYSSNIEHGMAQTQVQNTRQLWNIQVDGEAAQAGCSQMDQTSLETVQVQAAGTRSREQPSQQLQPVSDSSSVSLQKGMLDTSASSAAPQSAVPALSPELNLDNSKPLTRLRSGSRTKATEVAPEQTAIASSSPKRMRTQPPAPQPTPAAQSNSKLVPLPAEVEQKRYQCMRCREYFPTLEILTQHKNAKTCDMLRFRCDQCILYFKTLVQLREHKAVHSADEDGTSQLPGNQPDSNVAIRARVQTGASGSKLYKCLYCSQKFPNPVSCGKHQKCCDQKYKCDRCPAHYKSEYQLNYHKKIHILAETSRVSPHFCAECKQRFADAKSLRMHMRKHAFAKSHCCSMCPERFNSNKALADHIASHAGSFPCTQCDRVFSQASILAVHMRLHSGGKLFKCTDCDAEFDASYELKTHIQQLHSVEYEKKSQCDTCGKLFRDEKAVAHHQRTHSNVRAYKCTECPKAFFESAHLESHKLCHTGAKPYKCTECGKAFRTSGLYVIHLRIHTGEKPYHCHLCDKRCTTTGNLAAHMRSHTGDLPFSCNLCYKSFNDCNALAIHRQSHGYY